MNWMLKEKQLNKRNRPRYQRWPHCMFSCWVSRMLQKSSNKIASYNSDAGFIPLEIVQLPCKKKGHQTFQSQRIFVTSNGKMPICKISFSPSFFGLEKKPSRTGRAPQPSTHPTEFYRFGSQKPLAWMTTHQRT